MNAFQSPIAVKHAHRFIVAYRASARNKDVTLLALLMRNIATGKPLLNGISPLSRPSKMIGKSPWHNVLRLLEVECSRIQRITHPRLNNWALMPFYWSSDTDEAKAYNHWLIQLLTEVAWQIKTLMARPTRENFEYYKCTPVQYSSTFQDAILLNKEI